MKTLKNMLSDFFKRYRTVVTAVIFLTVVFMLLYFFFTLDEYYKAKMSKELTCMTECGEASDRSSCVSVSSGSDIVFRSGDTSGSRLAITCNVDWGEEVLPGMLDTLDKYGVKITFFVTGKWAEKNPALLREMYMRGHEIQSHGYSHKLCSQVTKDEVESEMDKASDIIFRTIGKHPDIFAPPSGDFDDSTVELCREKGYLLSLWSADTIDWREGSTADVIYDRIMKKDLHGAIILMHPKEETAKALPRLLEAFREQQLTPVTLSELIKEPSIDNSNMEIKNSSANNDNN